MVCLVNILYELHCEVFDFLIEFNFTVIKHNLHILHIIVPF
jgi:hypothetical protein